MTDIQRRTPQRAMRVAVTGATGLIGTALSDALRADGNTVYRVVRRNPTGDDISWDPVARRIDGSRFEGIDAVVHLAGHGIADGKWTDEHKRAVMESRVAGTTLLSDTLAGLQRPPAVFASGSAVGFYGDRGSEALTEQSPSGTGFLAEVVRRWEASTASAEAAGIRTVHLRTGIVLSTRGGALAQQLLPFRLGLGGRLGSGSQYLPWITLRDEVAAIRHVLGSAELGGPVNLCAPQPVTNSTFTKALGKVLKRPTLVPIPLLPLRVRFGAEMVREMLLSSTNAVPDRLRADGFTFADTEIESALRAVISGRI